MKMMRKVVMVLAMLVVAVSVQAEGTNIAFINTTQVVERVPQSQVIRESLQREFSPKEAELTTKQNNIKQLDEKLQRDGAIMSATEKRKLEREVMAKQREFQQERELFAKELNQRRTDELSKLQAQISQAVIGIAKERQFDMVLESGVVFVVNDVNITDTVVEWMTEMYNKETPPLKLQ